MRIMEMSEICRMIDVMERERVNEGMGLERGMMEG